MEVAGHHSSLKISEGFSDRKQSEFLPRIICVNLTACNTCLHSRIAFGVESGRPP